MVAYCDAPLVSCCVNMINQANAHNGERRMRFHLSGWLTALPFLCTMASAVELPRFEPQTIDAPNKVARGANTDGNADTITSIVCRARAVPAIGRCGGIKTFAIQLATVQIIAGVHHAGCIR